eukprot:sb/3468300/
MTSPCYIVQSNIRTGLGDIDTWCDPHPRRLCHQGLDSGNCTDNDIQGGNDLQLQDYKSQIPKWTIDIHGIRQTVLQEYKTHTTVTVTYSYTVWSHLKYNYLHASGRHSYANLIFYILCSFQLSQILCLFGKKNLFTWARRAPYVRAPVGRSSHGAHYVGKTQARHKPNNISLSTDLTPLSLYLLLPCLSFFNLGILLLIIIIFLQDILACLTVGSKLGPFSHSDSTPVTVRFVSPTDADLESLFVGVFHLALVLGHQSSWMVYRI